MRLLERYYLVQFLRTFTIICLGLTTLFSLTWLMRSSGELAISNPSIFTLLYLVLLDVPGSMVSAMPVSVLVATLLTMGQASGALELVAFSTSGGRLKRLMYPLLAAGVAICIISFMLGEIARPACSRKSMEVRNQLLGISSRLKLAGGGAIWIRTVDGAMAHLGFYSKKTDSYLNIQIFKTRDGQLLEVIKAQQATYSKELKTWTLMTVTIDRLDMGTSDKLNEMTYQDLPEPSEITAGQNYTDRMGALELARYLARIRAAGFKNNELVMELHSRFASPLVNLIMVILGVAVAARRSLGALKAAAIGVMVTALYWLVITISSAMGLTGVMPPYLASWISPALFLAISTRMYVKIPE